MTDLESKAREMIAVAKKTRKDSLARNPYGDSYALWATLRIETLQELLDEPHHLEIE